MPKITNEISKALQEAAKQFPLVFIDTCEKHIMTKQELDEMGFVSEEKLPDGKYIYTAPVQLAMNHFSGLKKYFRKHGKQGIVMYGQYVGLQIKQHKAFLAT